MWIETTNRGRFFQRRLWVIVMQKGDGVPSNSRCRSCGGCRYRTAGFSGGLIAVRTFVRTMCSIPFSRNGYGRSGSRTISTSPAGLSAYGGPMARNPKDRRVVQRATSGAAFSTGRGRFRSCAATSMRRSEAASNFPRYCPTDFRRQSRREKRVFGRHSLHGRQVHVSPGRGEQNFL